MTYICEKCNEELDDDTDAVLVLKMPSEDAVAYCLDKVTCAEAGADDATVFARRGAALIKRKSKTDRDAGESE